MSAWRRHVNSQEFLRGGPRWNTPRTFSIEALISWASECPQAIRESLQLISLETGVKTRAA